MDFRTGVLVFGAIAIAHSFYLILTLSLLSRKKANRILSLILLLFAVRTGKSVLSLLLPESAYGAAWAGLIAMTLLGPLLLIYINQVYVEKPMRGYQPYLHFLPTLLCFPFLFIHDWTLINYAYYLVTAQMTGYIIFCLFRLYVGKQYYAADDLQWNWLMWLVVASLVLNVSFVIQLIAYNPVVYLSNVMLATVSAYGLSIMGLRSIRLFSENPKKRKTDERLSQEVGERIRMMLEEREIFCDPELNVSRLAQRLKLPPYVVSKSVNQFFQTSFPELLLKHRLKKAEHLLITKGTLFSVEGVAYESGFNTLSAFYTSFKKHHGMTPSQFKQQHAGKGGSMKIA